MGEDSSLVNVRRTGSRSSETFAFRVRGTRFSIGSMVEVKGDNCYFTPKNNKTKQGTAGIDFDILFPMTQPPHAFGEYLETVK